MSITDELREYTEKQIKWLDMTKVHYRKLFSIADRIDAEHQKAIRELNNLADASVLLPVDADGVPIRIGDVIAYKDNTKPKEVVALVPPSVVMVEDGPRHADMCRHYHEPTVEDVLHELVIEWDCSLDCEDKADVIKEYAAKLQLREGA